MQNALLKKRLAERPLMEPQDAVKLVFQSEFGCGHLLAEEQACAERIAWEMKSLAAAEPLPAYESLGEGLCRLNLQAPEVRALPPVWVARMMRQTADRGTGSQARFLQKLESLKTLCREGGLPFGTAELEAYLAAYEQQGYPLVSHSETYRRAYAPAYRVVREVYGQALPLIAAVRQRLSKEGRALVVLDGDCAAGKTTLATALAPLWRAPVIPMDGFFLPLDLRSAERLDTPGGNTHFERFQAEVLGGLLRQREVPARPDFVYHSYDCHTGKSRPCQVPDRPVVLVEGSYSLHPAFDAAYEQMHAIRVFLAVAEQRQLRRLAARNPALLSRFQDEWIPLEKAYAKAYDIANQAEIRLCLQEGEP